MHDNIEFWDKKKPKIFWCPSPNVEEIKHTGILAFLTRWVIHILD